VDCAPTAIVTTSCGLEPNKKVNYVEILTEALEISAKSPKVLIRQRPGL
jgi:propionyl-CoA synthetase